MVPRFTKWGSMGTTSPLEDDDKDYNYKFQIHTLIGKTIKGLAAAKFEKAHPLFDSSKFREICDIKIERYLNLSKTEDELEYSFSPLQHAVFDISNRVISNEVLKDLC